jgi:xanthine/uracil permease
MALLMGLQYAFAMFGGLITPPYFIFRFTIHSSSMSFPQHGDVFLGYASSEFIVLGFSVLMFLISIKVCNGEVFQHYSLFARTGHLTISVACCYDRFPAALL